jgi:Protein of unknown function (DUF3592)
MSTFFPNIAYVRLWRVAVRLFLFFGAIAALEQSWGIASEIQARYGWPTAPGTIVSSHIEDDKEMPGKIIDPLHTHYWVVYEVRFAAGEDQCRTGTFYGGPPSSMPCAGTVRTRSTRSPQQAWEWMRDPSISSRSVTVLHNPRSPEIKIAGSSLRLFYPWTNSVLAFVWVIGFWIFHAFLQRRLKYLESHPETQTNPAETRSSDKFEITSLDLS